MNSRLSFLFLVVLVYGPALFFSFAHHDQYRYFRVPAVEKTSCEEDSQFFGLFYDLGRPVTAWMECLQFKTVNRLADFTWYRLLALGLILCLSFLLARVFERRWKVSAVSSGLLAASICLLPGFLNLFIMTNNAVLLALNLGALAFLNFQTRPLRWMGSFVLLLIALFSYPAGAFLVLALAFADFLFTKDKTRPALRRLASVTILCFLASSIFFAIVKLIMHPLADYDLRHPGGEGWGGGTYAFRLSTDLIARLGFFFRALSASVNFWNIYLSHALALAVLALSAGLVIKNLSSRKRDFRLKLIVALVGFLPVSAPLVFSNINEILFRTLIALSAYALIVLVWLAREAFALKSFPRWTVSILIAGVAAFHLLMSVRNSVQEMSFVTGEIKERQLLGQKILLIKNIERDQARLGINGLPSVTDEFNVNTTVFGAEEPLYVMRAALLEAGANPAIKVYSCADAEDCAKAETVAASFPNVYIVSKRPDFGGFPARLPVIDMEPFSR